MLVSQFLNIVAIKGFTRACEIYNINRTMLKKMCEEIIEKNPNLITPFSTKQQIVYHYLSIKLEKENL